MITEHEPGGFRDRCGKCGGWISMGHAEGSSCRVALEDDDDHGELPLICPVTGAPCTTEQDEFCEDYGCARKAGVDVDRDLIP